MSFKDILLGSPSDSVSNTSLTSSSNYLPIIIVLVVFVVMIAFIYLS
jgi:sensor domain CHASE-containing protein